MTDDYFSEELAADFLELEADTLRVWRNKTRRAGYLIGPLWSQKGGTGRARIIRYRKSDLVAWLDAGRVTFEPRKPRGRPRKTAAAIPHEG